MKKDKTMNQIPLSEMPANALCILNCGCVVERSHEGNMFYTKKECGRRYGDTDCVDNKYHLGSYDTKPTIDILKQVYAKPIYRTWKFYLNEDIQTVTALSYDEALEDYLISKDVISFKELEYESRKYPHHKPKKLNSFPEDVWYLTILAEMKDTSFRKLDILLHSEKTKEQYLS